MTIYDRFKLLLDGRQENPWAKGLGIDRSAIRRMKEEDKAPDWEPLSAIRNAERLCLRWLNEGEGEQFEVHRYVSDADCAYALSLMLADEDWTVVIASDGHRQAIVLHQPAQGVVGGRGGRETPYNYTLSETLLGAGPASLATIAEKAGRIELAIIATQQLEAIYRAQAGTWRLLQAPDAWLKNARRIDPSHPIFSQSPPATYQLSPDEARLIATYQAMEPGQRQTYQAIGVTLAQQSAAPAATPDPGPQEQQLISSMIVRYDLNDLGEDEDTKDSQPAGRQNRG